MGNQGGRISDALFAGPGDAKARCREVDWSATPLGAPERWPPGLRAAVRVCLDSRTLMAVWAGPEFTLIHNDGYSPVLGTKQTWAMGKPGREVWSEVWEQIRGDFEAATRGAATRHERSSFRLKRGEQEEEAHFTYSLTPIREEDGSVSGVFNVLEETTLIVRELNASVAALQESRARLEEADRRKSEFLAVLSHELRNPLTPVKNSLYILDRAAPGSEQALRAKAVIERQVDQLTHLVDDLLDITRIARGKIQLHRRRLELNDLLRRAIDDHQSLFERGGLSIELTPASGEVFIDGDWNRIAQVFGNLLQNAAKFTPHRGRVKVTLTVNEAARLAEVRVADSGPGIHPEMLPRLFEPFMQAETTLDRSKGGLGLGLALAKGLVEQHGGTITAASGGAGQGAEFVVRLPLDAARKPAEAAGEPIGSPQPHRRVLIIEDNQDAADSLCEALELSGHRVAVAYNGNDGIATARAFGPEVVFCDVGLPGIDGYGVARIFRSDPSLKHIHLVALTGYALPGDVRLAAEAGFDKHLAKPPRLEALEDIIAKIA